MVYQNGTGRLVKWGARGEGVVRLDQGGVQWRRLAAQKYQSVSTAGGGSGVAIDAGGDDDDVVSISHSASSSNSLPDVVADGDDDDFVELDGGGGEDGSAVNMASMAAAAAAAPRVRRQGDKGSGQGIVEENCGSGSLDISRFSSLSLYSLRYSLQMCSHCVCGFREQRTHCISSCLGTHWWGRRWIRIGNCYKAEGGMIILTGAVAGSSPLSSRKLSRKMRKRFSVPQVAS